MKLEEIDISEINNFQELKDIRSKLETEEEKEELIERVEELKNGKDKEPEPELDKWLCVRCKKEFEYKAGETPFECPKCHKSANKTVFKALTGPYQYFDLSGRKRFVREKLGKDILEDYHIKTLEDNEEIYIFNDVCYEPVGANLIRKEVQQRLGPECVKNRIDEVIDDIQIRTLTPLEEFDTDPYVVAVKNGYLNIRTGELEEPDPDKIITTKIPVKYNPEVEFEGSNIEEFLLDILDKDYLKPIQELLGYCLFKKYSYKKGFMLKGPAHTGKTTLLNLIKKFLGQENITDQSLKDLSDYKFARASLFQRLANLSDDLDASKINNIGTFKMLTGSSSINAPIKHKQDQLIFENYATMVFTANRYPKINDPDQAWWERWVLIEFEKQFFPEDPHTIPQDILMERITEDKELTGLLNWAVEGFERLFNQGHFTRPEKSKEIEKKWIRETDSLKAFVMDYCEEDRNCRVIKKEFYNAYTDFCGVEGLPVVEENTVGRNLPSYIPYVSTKQPKIDTGDSNRQRYVWSNIRLKEPYDQYNRPKNIVEEEPEDQKDNNQSNLTIIEEDQSFKANLRDFLKAGPKKCDDIVERFTPRYEEDQIIYKIVDLKMEGFLIDLKERGYKLNEADQSGVI